MDWLCSVSQMYFVLSFRSNNNCVWRQESAIIIHVFLEKCTFETPKPNQGFVYCSSRVQKAKFSSFNKPIWAIVVFWVAEKSNGKERRHRLKRLWSDWQWFQTQRNELSDCTWCSLCLMTHCGHQNRNESSHCTRFTDALYPMDGIELPDLKGGLCFPNWSHTSAPRAPKK